MYRPFWPQNAQFWLPAQVCSTHQVTEVVSPNGAKKNNKKLNQVEPQIICQRLVYRIVRITQTVYPRSSLVLSKRLFSMS